jgi:large subunit ribosomal protein L13
MEGDLLMLAGQKTYYPKTAELTSRWYLVDARGQTLGRLATNVARILRGKHRPEYTPGVNTGDHVIVINSRDLVVTGNKREGKEYDRYSGYPGGRRVRSYAAASERDATFPLRHAIEGMLQHNTLGAAMAKHLRVYAGPDHGHAAQNPTPIEFGELGQIVVKGENN